MTDIQPVVLGLVDKQPAALAMAVHEARRLGAPLRIVHAAAMPFAQMEMYASESVVRDMMIAGQTLLDGTQRDLSMSDPDLRVEYVLSPTTPTDLLVKESAGAQLLVIGLDHIPWYDRLVGAATTGHVVRYSRCALIAVPEDEHDRAGREGVVVALDGNSGAMPLLRSAFESADERGCTLHALQVIPSNADVQETETARVSLGEVLAGWGELFPDVRVEVQVVKGEPSTACVEATRHAELVMVGRSRRHGLHRPTSAMVLRHAQCPVWIVPLDDSLD